MYSSLACMLLAATGLVHADAIYTKNSPVLQVTAKTYDSLITQSNHTSIVEFYAPWCGHCQSLKPAYEKAAKSLLGLAKVAAINCDEDENKSLCGQLGVQGFPTLKIVKPGSKRGRPTVEDYQGPRQAKAIVDAVLNKVSNHVKKVQDSDYEAFINDNPSQAKVILFSEKGTISPLIKALAIDFLGSISFAQVRNKEQQATKHFDVTKFPTVVLLPGEGQQPIVYDGEIKKDAIVNFLGQVAAPNPDPAPRKSKPSPSKKSKATDSTASSKFTEASKAHKSSDYSDYMQSTGTVILEDDIPVESPMPIVDQDEKPLVVKDILPDLPQLDSAEELQAACLLPKSGTCLLILSPTHDSSDDTPNAVASFAEVAHKHKDKNSIFPVFSVPAENTLAAKIRETLNLSPEKLEVIAVNNKRKWWRIYTAETFSIQHAEDFVDAIRFGEGSKHKLPAGWLADEATQAPAAETDSAHESSSSSTHDEL